MQEEYKIYVTDSLYYYMDDKRLTYRFCERDKVVPKVMKTGEEIVQEIVEKGGLTIG